MWRVCGSRRWLRGFRVGGWCWEGRGPPVDGGQARGEDPARRGRTRPSNFPESRLSSKIYLSCPMASDEELEAALQGLTISGAASAIGQGVFTNNSRATASVTSVASRQFGACSHSRHPDSFF